MPWICQPFNSLGFTKVITKGKWVSARGGHLADLIAAQV